MLHEGLISFTPILSSACFGSLAVCHKLLSFTQLVFPLHGVSPLCRRDLSFDFGCIFHFIGGPSDGIARLPPPLCVRASLFCRAGSRVRGPELFVDGLGGVAISLGGGGWTSPATFPQALGFLYCTASRFFPSLSLSRCFDDHLTGMSSLLYSGLSSLASFLIPL